MFPKLKISLLKNFPFQAAPDFIDLIRAVYTTRLILVLTAGVTVAAGGGADGVLLDEHLLRLADVRVVWDNIELVPRLPLYWIGQLTKHHGRQPPRYTGLANPGIQTATAVSAYVEIPFARNWLHDPWNTVLPPVPVMQQLQLQVFWNQSITAGSTIAGTGALVSGGTRVITFSTAPQLSAYQEFAPVSSVYPWYIPVYSLFNTQQLTAANTQLGFEINSGRRMDASLLRFSSNAEFRLQNGINTINLVSAQERHIDSLNYSAAHWREAEEYPGISQAGADDLGYAWIRHADGGLLSNALDPRTMQNLRWVLDVQAPTTSPSIMHELRSELITFANITQMQGV